MVVDLEKFKKSGNKLKSFDLAIPLILIAVIALLIYYHGIPIPGFGQDKIRVVVIGDLQKTAPELYKRFQEEAIHNRIVGYGYGFEDDVIAYSPKILNQADLIILAGDAKLDTQAAENIRKAVESGKNLLVLMDAGTASPDDPYYSPWNDELAPILPVSLATFNESKALHKFKMNDVKEAYIYILDPEHPLVKGYGLQPKLNLKEYINNSDEVLKVYEAYPKDGNIVLWLKVVLKNGEEYNIPILVEKQTAFGGKVIYLGMDVGYIPELSKKLVLYAAGKSGNLF